MGAKDNYGRTALDRASNEATRAVLRAALVREEEAIREVYTTIFLKDVLINAILDFCMPKLAAQQRQAREAAAKEGKTLTAEQARELREVELFKRRLMRVLIWGNVNGVWKLLVSLLPFELSEEVKREVKQRFAEEKRLDELDEVQQMASGLLGNVLIPLHAGFWRLRAMKTQLHEAEEKVKALAAHRESGEEKEADGQQQALAEMKTKLRAEIAAMESVPPPTSAPVSLLSSSSSSSSSSSASSSSSSTTRPTV